MHFIYIQYLISATKQCILQSILDRDQSTCLSSRCVFSTADKQQKEVWSSRLQKWLHERFGVYIEDFRFQPEENTVEAEEPLSAKRWEPLQNTTRSVYLQVLIQEQAEDRWRQSANSASQFLSTL